MRRIETLKEGTEAVGNRVRVKVVKNKVAAPFRQAEFDIEYGAGISHEGGLLDLALEHDLVQKSGSFFSYGELRLGQGRNNTKQYLAENPELAQEIETKLFAELGVERAPAPPRAVPEAEPETEAEEAAGRAGAQGGLSGARACPIPPARSRRGRGRPSSGRSRPFRTRSAPRRSSAPGWRGGASSRRRSSAAVELLVETGGLDDERFARQFASDKRELRGWGPERIREALAARGVDRDLIEAALAGDGRGSQLERALELLERRGEAPTGRGRQGPGARLPRPPRLRLRARPRCRTRCRTPRGLTARRVSTYDPGCGHRPPEDAIGELKPRFSREIRPGEAPHPATLSRQHTRARQSRAWIQPAIRASRPSRGDREDRRIAEPRHRPVPGRGSDGSTRAMATVAARSRRSTARGHGVQRRRRSGARRDRRRASGTP